MNSRGGNESPTLIFVTNPCQNWADVGRCRNTLMLGIFYTASISAHLNSRFTRRVATARDLSYSKLFAKLVRFSFGSHFSRFSPPSYVLFPRAMPPSSSLLKTKNPRFCCCAPCLSQNPSSHVSQHRPNSNNSGDEKRSAQGLNFSVSIPWPGLPGPLCGTDRSR